ncbi:MAG: chloride channel protein [Candidatus Binatia bacterium]|nr:MAG: chloride channel protein [Candidatus Binatia bacterium]
MARSLRLVGWAVAVGVLAGLAAAFLDRSLEVGIRTAIGRFTSPGGAEVFRFHWAVLFLPALGGIVSGVAIRLFAPASPGHGTDQLVRAFHYRDGRLDLRGPLVRGVSAVAVISCGGSAGPEGPIAALGASIGSTVARWARLSPREVRVLLLAGCAGGVGAIFRCPLGGALFGTSILYREPEFESESLVPAFVASVVSYSTFMGFDTHGARLLREADRLAFSSPVELPLYLVAGVVCGLFAILLSLAFHFVRSRSERLSGIPVWLRPGLGGLVTGALGVLLPQVMDSQYVFVQSALDGSVFSGFGPDEWTRWALFFGLVAVAKCVATAFTVGSGAAGGLLGPSVFIGGVVGAFVGAACNALLPWNLPEPLRQALIPVGMAGVLSAAMRIPIAAMVMVVEMTGSYGLVVPLMLVSATAYLVGRGWGLVPEQVRSSAQSPAHAGDAVVELLETYQVQDVMQKPWPYVARPNTKLGEILKKIRPGTRPCFAVLEGDRLVGLISVTDILQHGDTSSVSQIVVADDLMTRNMITIRPDASLYEALRLFQTHDVNALPVVENHGRGGRFLGMLTRQDVYALVRRQMDAMRQHVLREHDVLEAIDEENTLGQLLAHMPTPEIGTVERMSVPPELAGKSLRDVDFRRVYKAEVLAIQTREGRFLCPPDPARPLRLGDHLVVLTGRGEKAEPEERKAEGRSE